MISAQRRPEEERIVEVPTLSPLGGATLTLLLLGAGLLLLRRRSGRASP